MNGIILISKERQEQITKHKFDANHDAKPFNENQELLMAAAYLLQKVYKGNDGFISATYPPQWNHKFKDKFDKKNDVDSLTVAGALIAAEIDKIILNDNSTNIEFDDSISSFFDQNGNLHPFIEKLLRFTIKEWISPNEKEEPDHNNLVDYWLKGDCKKWIQTMI